MGHFGRGGGGGGVGGMGADTGHGDVGGWDGGKSWGNGGSSEGMGNVDIDTAEYGSKYDFDKKEAEATGTDIGGYGDGNEKNLNDIKDFEKEAEMTTSEKLAVSSLASKVVTTVATVVGLGALAAPLGLAAAVGAFGYTSNAFEPTTSPVKEGSDGSPATEWNTLDNEKDNKPIEKPVETPEEEEEEEVIDPVEPTPEPLPEPMDNEGSYKVDVGNKVGWQSSKVARLTDLDVYRNSLV